MEKNQMLFLNKETAKNDIYYLLLEYKAKCQELYPRSIRNIGETVGIYDIGFVRRILIELKSEGKIGILEFVMNNEVFIQL